MTRRLSFSILAAKSALTSWAMLLLLILLCASSGFASEQSGGAVPPPDASYEQNSRFVPSPAASSEIVADKWDFQILSAGAVMLHLQVGDNDGYGYGAGSVPDGATLPTTNDPVGNWFFDNRSSSERTHPYAVATDHQQWNQKDYTLVHSYDPAWFSTIDSAYYIFDVSGLQQGNRCPDNPTERSHLLFDGVEQTAFLSINQGTWGSGVYRYPVDVKSILSDGQLSVLFDQHNDCFVSPYGDVWAIDYAALQVYGQEAPVPVPTLASPSNGSTVSSPRPTFTWSQESVQYYTLQVSTTANFSSPITYGKISGSSFVIPQSLSNGTYYWRVAGQSIFGTAGAFSAARTLTVNASLVVPSNFPTIQAAVNSAATGDTIYVEPGTYPSKGNADFTVNSLSSVVIMSTGGASSTIIQADAASFGINLNYVTDFDFSGFTIRGIAGNFATLLTLSDPDSVRITDCILENGDGYGIYAYGYDRIGKVTVTRCEFRDCGSSGVYFDGPYFVFEDCLFEGNDQGFVYSAGGTAKNANNAENFVFKGCNFINNNYAGARFSYADSVMVDSCTFDGNGDGGIWFDNYTDGTVMNSEFRNNSTVEWASAGVNVYYYSSLTMTDCLFENNFGYDAGAVYFGYLAQNLNISNCSFLNNEEGAIMIDNGGGFGVPERFKDRPAPTAASPAATLSIDRCNFNYNRVSPPVNVRNINFGDNLVLSCSNIYGNGAGDWIGYVADQLSKNGNSTGDPLFCDTANGDYTIAANSPLVSATCGTVGLYEVGCDAVQFALSADSIYFESIKGQGNPPTQTIAINNLGGSVLPWTRGSEQLPSWLYSNPTHGVAPTNVTIGVVTGFQNIGVYVDTVYFYSDNAVVSPVRVVVVLNLRSPNSPPVIDTVDGTATVETDVIYLGVTEGSQLQAAVSVADPDGDIVSLTASNLPSGATFNDAGNNSGILQWTPISPLADTNFVTIIADDGEFADTITIGVVVTPNTPPVFTTVFNNVQIIEGSDYLLSIAVNDPDGQNLSISWNSQPPIGVFVDHGNLTATFSYTPNTTAVGQTYNVIFYVTDGIAADTGQFTLEVLNNILQVSGASPSPGGTTSDVLVTDIIRVSFNELFDESTLAGNVSASSTLGQTLSVQPGVDESQAIPFSYLDIESNEPRYRNRDQITLQIGNGLTDLAGFAIDKAYTFTFWTGATVYPGDMTNDGVVNERDVLPLGIYWGESGPARPIQSLAWNDFPAHIFTGGQSWEPYQAAYADADGDGSVDGADICGITDNWHASLTGQPNKTADVVEQVKAAFAGKSAAALSEMYQAALECEPTAGRAVVLKGLEASMGLGGASLPDDFTLYQNYPNPFNPSTMIKLYLPEASNVRLSVYNLLGQEVARLLDGSRDQGFVEVEWDATDSNGRRVASGLYFYRLTTDTKSITKRMMLVK